MATARVFFVEAEHAFDGVEWHAEVFGLEARQVAADIARVVDVQESA